MAYYQSTMTALLLCFGLVFSSPILSWAQDKKEEPKKIENVDSDKLDIQKLEQKYWSAKDDDFSVIQNRAFPKEKRVYLSANYGVPFNDPNSVGSLTGVNLGYFFNERWGLELGYTNSNFKFNDTVDYFKKEYGVLPDHNTFKSAQTLMAYWVPIYAKMSLMDKKIIYFDMGIGLGVGTTTYEQNSCTVNAVCKSGTGLNGITKTSQTSSHYAFSIMQQFFLTQNWAIRVDLINRFTDESRISSRNEQSIGSKMVNDTALQFGVTFWK
ncbi:MAG: outer membrane beta-barrel domain-containing protein [Bdellovibrionaceae bacterium]|nr:outer membrane beta-barrel domain-containing protein [Pseudobdellovibrionaceae bacterium]